MKKNITLFSIVLASVVAGFLTQNLLHQKEHPLAKYSHEKVVLVNFWATWCPPCREEIPDFIRLHKEFKDQGFTVIGLAIDKGDKVRAFEQEMGINYPSFIAEKEGYALMEEYGSTHGALPYTVILDRDGSIVYEHHKGILHYEEAKALIEPLL